MIRRLSAAVLTALLGLILHTGVAQAQAQSTGSITGKVTDSASATPLGSAQLLIVGTTRGTVARDDGTFIISGVTPGAHRLRVSRIGYLPREVPVTVTAGIATPITVSLTRTAVQLSEMVVVGYGTQRREDLTGSIASVTSEQLQQTTVNTLEQGLQGRVAGVQITQGDAAPGGGMRVQIRGVNSMNAGSAQPLYVIDGVMVARSDNNKAAGSLSEINLRSLTETNPLAQFAPEDIESIDILKDASATAIYGSRGANGVVLITTKKGSRNRPGQYTFNYSQGMATVGRQIDVLNAPDFATYVNTAYINAFGPQTEYPYGGRPGSMTPDSIRKVVGTGTNWQDEIFRAAPVSNATLGFSGGDERGSYYVSGKLLKQGGIITGSEFQRAGLRINLDRDVTSRFRLSTTFEGTRSNNDMVRTSTISGWRSVGIVRQALTYTPMMFRDTTTNDARLEDATTWSTYGANPLRYTDEVNENDQITSGIGGLRGVYRMPFGFSFDQNVGFNYERRTYGSYFPRTVNEGRNAQGVAIAFGSEYGNYLTESLLRFNREYGTLHRVDAFGGFTYQSDASSWNTQEAQNFPNDILGGNVIQNGTQPLTPQSGLGDSRLASYLGRVNYSLNNRYLFTATIRRDGSSKFAANNKWATFPGLAFAWKAVDEPWMKNQSVLSDLKFRVSWGRSGNQAIGSYQSLPAISGVPTTMNEIVVPAYVITQLGNPDLRWETTTQRDAGVDFALFTHRLTGTVDVYSKRTNDLLQQVQLTPITGFGSAWLNSGSVTNRGIEFQLGYDVVREQTQGGFNWNVGANASRNRNRIESLGTGSDQQFAPSLGSGGGLEASPFIQKVGLPIGAIWGYRTNGIVRTPGDSAAYRTRTGITARVGDLMYQDLNGDSAITQADREQIGDANPDWTFGFTNQVRFGRFDLSTLVTAVRGNDILNAERMRYLVLDGSMNVPEEYIQNSFDPVKNPNGKYPQIRQDRKADARFHDLYLEDGSFVRLKNVQLGYRLQVGGRTAYIYGNAINLLTWTKYTGFDPEVSAFGGVNRPGVDLGSYPMSRIFTFGVNTSF